MFICDDVQHGLWARTNLTWLEFYVTFDIIRWCGNKMGFYLRVWTWHFRSWTTKGVSRHKRLTQVLNKSPKAMCWHITHHRTARCEECAGARKATLQLSRWNTTFRIIYIYKICHFELTAIMLLGQANINGPMIFYACCTVTVKTQ